KSSTSTASETKPRTAWPSSASAKAGTTLIAATPPWVEVSSPLRERSPSRRLNPQVAYRPPEGVNSKDNRQPQIAPNPLAVSLDQASDDDQPDHRVDTTVAPNWIPVRLHP